MTRGQEQQLLETISRYDELKEEGDVGRHPFVETRKVDLQPADIKRLGGSLSAAWGAAGSLHC